MAQENRIGNLRYPIDLDGDGNPWVTFSTHRPRYANGGTKINTEISGDAVSMYIPSGMAISDSIRYESHQEGLLGAAIERFNRGTITDVSMDDITSIATQNTENIASLATAAAGGLAGGGPGALVGAALPSTGNIKALFQRERGRIMNPREYMLFKAPSIREFPFNFTFIPQSEEEAKEVPKIIKFFRKAAYPAMHERGIDYIFPDAFTITFGRTSSMIRIPEVVLTSVDVTYNPNSISYFEYDRMPVEITMEMSFQELRPIDRGMVEQGY